MQFITTGNRIAVENFTLGDLYTITFTSGTYINSACIGIGENFVSFQRNEPELLFTLNLETAELVSSIDLYAGGTGTTNYEDLTNKPQIGGVELDGNKSLSDLGIQPEITEESQLSSSLVSGLGSAAAAESSDFATAAEGALAASAIQSAGTGLSKSGTTLNHSNSVTAKTTEGFASITYDAQGHITGSTPATTAQLAALNSGATSTDIEQIETNKTNISYYQANGSYNKLRNSATTQTVSNTTFTVNSDGTVDISGKPSSGNAQIVISDLSELENGQQYTFYNGGTVQESTNIYFGLLGASGVPNLIIPPNGITITLDKSQYLSAIIRVTSSSPITTANFKPMATKGTISHSYEPYALSNAELTKAILAIQAQLANT